MLNIKKYPINLIYILIISLIFFLFINFNKGIELSDESYLILIGLYPELIVGKVNNSGYISKFLIFLSNNNFHIFRILGGVILIGSIYFFYISVIKSINNKVIFKNLDYKYLFPILLIGFLNYYRNWVITPSYNLYNLASILIFLSSLINILNFSIDKKKINLIFNLIILNSSAVICFICKPTTAVLLSLIYIFWLIFFYRLQNLKLTILYTLFIFLGIFGGYILLTFGSINNFISDTILGIELKTLLDPRYDILNNFIIIIKQFVFHIYVNFKIILIFIILAFLFNLFVKKFFEELLFISSFLIFIISSDIILLLFFFIFIFFFREVFFNYKKVVKQKNLVFFIFILLLLIFSYTAGTNTNAVTLSETSTILYLVIIYFIINSMKINLSYINKNIFMILILLVYTFFNLVENFEKPRRYSGKILNYSYPIKLSNFKNEILVDQNLYNFRNKINSIFIRNDWKSKNYLIDLTGRAPGIKLLIDAKFLSEPWWGAGYIGSNNKARKLIKITNYNKVREAWLITTDSETRISKDVLSEVGLNLERDYEMVGFANDLSRNYFVWKPKLID